MTKLDPREQIFADAYAAGKSATEALFAAGLSTSNVSRDSKRLLRKQNVKEYIEKIQSDARALAMVDTVKLMTQLAQVAFFDSKELWELANNPDGEWSPAARASIASVKVTKTYREGNEERGAELDITTELKSKPTLQAAKMLGDHLAAFKDLPTLIAGLKSYGIDLRRVDGRYVVVEDDSDAIAA
jgi:phage terminase small subunit